jgi:formylglycine-generating enzyme required for sulfatase activity
MKHLMSMLSFLVIASAACASRQNPPSSPFDSQAEIAITSKPGQGLSNPTLESPINQGSCQTSKWEVVPVSVVSIPAHDQPSWVGTETPPNGWNIVFVAYAVLNKSDLWGSVSINNGLPTLTTEGGFTYNTVGMQGVWMRSDQEIPAPVTQIHPQTSPFGNGDMGKMLNQPLIYFTEYIPPHFAVLGTVQGYTSQWSGPPEGWTDFPYYSVFRVAATQKQLTLSLPDIEINCIQDGANQQGTIPARKFELDNYSSDWHQYATPASVPNLGSAFDFAAIGTVAITSTMNESGNATVKFKFTNHNQGTQTTGTLNAYVVDSQGYMHRFQGGQFDAGPAATVDGQDLETLGGVPEGDPSLKIVFWIETRPASTSIESYAVFSINFGASSLDTNPPNETPQSPQANEPPLLATTEIPQAVAPPSVSHTPGAPASASVRTRLADNMMMILVPEGDFVMGSRDGIGDDDEHPRHTVYLSAFWMDRTEVTNAMYSLCVHAGVCPAPVIKKSSTRGTYYGDSAYDEYPVVNVDWNQASSYCDWAGARLPTEAEWEKAARGTDGRTYPWGEGIDCTFANYYGCGLNDTVATNNLDNGTSPYGIYGLAGNVSEWVADWYDPNYYRVSPASNPSGPSSGQGRVLRGGSWNHFPDKVSVSTRLANQPEVWDYAIGFRCAAAAP